MKAQLDIVHTGTLGTEGRVAMRFDEDSITHLMTVLTDLYSNRTLAVIREYSTNAFDAHIAAGNPAPIQVTLPNSLTNMLVIKDFGTGMSKDDITEHFSKYGWSSKRESDDEVGMLGLGCKAGLTYTSQFTLVTVQDGIKNVVLVTREESGGGVVQIIDTVSTDEPNGTEVQIPAKDWYDVVFTATEFFQYWDRGTVLVDGEEPACIWDATNGTIALDNDIILIPTTGGNYNSRSQHNNRSQIVMGNVAYPVNDGKLPTTLQRNLDKFKAVIRVPIGTVNFIPSREELNYSKRTLETIETAWEYIYQGMFMRIQSQIDACVSAKDAYTIWQNWRYVLSYSTHQRNRPKKLTYQSLQFIDHIEIPDKNQTLFMSVHGAAWGADRSERASESERLETCYAAALHVVGFKGTAIAATTKKRIREYARQRGITSGKIMVYPRPFGSPWLTNQTVNRVRFDVVQNTHIEDDDFVKEVKQRVKIKYRVLYSLDALEHYDDLPETVEAWLPAGFTEVPRKEVTDFSGRNVVAVVLAADEKKFMRDHPTIQPWVDWAKDRIAAASLQGTEWDWFMYWRNQLEYSVPTLIQEISADKRNKLVDSTLRILIEEWNEADDDKFAFRDMMIAVRTMARRFDDLTIPDVPKAPQVLERFKEITNFYEGLLDMSMKYSDSKVGNAQVQAVNAFYILKSQLHVIPVL